MDVVRVDSKKQLVKKEAGLVKSILLTLLGVIGYAHASPFLPLLINNESHIASDSNVYITIKATNITDNQQCFVQFNEAGQGNCIDVTANTSSQSYAYALSYFPKNNAGQRELFLPQVISGRIYFSIGAPLSFAINTSNPQYPTIVDPDGFKMRDVNYYKLYDKVEFSYNSAGVWINPTAVDFFAIPLQISMPDSLSNFKMAGFGDSRADIIDHLEQTFKNDAGEREPSTLTQWNNLFLYYNPAETHATSGTVLRVMAPAKAMVSASGLTHNPSFNSNYLDDSSLGFEYINQLWQYYSEPGHNVLVDCSELEGDPNAPKLGNYIFSGHVINDNFVFTNQTGDYHVSIPKPDSLAFFAGAGGSFNYPNHTPGAIIVRELSAAFEVGLLPNDGELLNSTFFKNNQNIFYQDNVLLNAGNTGPWYDLYSKALHSLNTSSDPQPIYTFAYDDALGQDGTLYENNANNPGPVSITVGDMSGTSIPNPTVDSNTYNVTISLGENSQGKYYPLYYNEQLITPLHPAVLNNVHSPLQMNFNGQVISVYILHPMVVPYTPIADGITIQKPADSNQVTLAFPGPLEAA